METNPLGLDGQEFSVRSISGRMLRKELGIRNGKKVQLWMNRYQQAVVKVEDNVYV